MGALVALLVKADGNGGWLVEVGADGEPAVRAVGAREIAEALCRVLDKPPYGRTVERPEGVLLN